MSTLHVVEKRYFSCVDQGVKIGCLVTTTNVATKWSGQFDNLWSSYTRPQLCEKNFVDHQEILLTTLCGEKYVSTTVTGCNKKTKMYSIKPSLHMLL